MKNRKKTFEIALLGLLLALEFVFAYVKIPMASGLCFTFYMVPVAIAAFAMGIRGGAIVGGIFGLLSFSTCFGWFGGDAFGALLLNMNPFYTFVLCVVTRVMVGALAAAIHKLISKWVDVRICYMITGFLTALLNTILFMSALVLLFGNTAEVQGMVGGKSFLLFIVTSVGINSVIEIVISTVLTGAVGTALKKAKLI
ncbi:MAG: ECF transporter S component [Clostridia bacterium]|nr:ECF transporter S component [Clostridia bacterium]